MDKSSIEREVSSAKQLADRHERDQAIETLQKTQSEARVPPENIDLIEIT
jgi:hypothetical protein